MPSFIHSLFLRQSWQTDESTGYLQVLRVISKQVGFISEMTDNLIQDTMMLSSENGKIVRNSKYRASRIEHVCACPLVVRGAQVGHLQFPFSSSTGRRWSRAGWPPLFSFRSTASWEPNRREDVPGKMPIMPDLVPSILTCYSLNEETVYY